MKKLGSLYGVEIWANPTFYRALDGEFVEREVSLVQIEGLATPFLNLLKAMDCQNIKLKSIEVK